VRSDLQTQRYLLSLTVGVKQKAGVHAIITKFDLAAFTVVLFHYDGQLDAWRDLPWFNSTIHVRAATLSGPHSGSLCLWSRAHACNSLLPHSTLTRATLAADMRTQAVKVVVCTTLPRARRRIALLPHLVCAH
jgi:hypothetical protein